MSFFYEHKYVPCMFITWIVVICPIVCLILFGKGYSIRRIFWTFSNSWVGFKRRRIEFGASTLIERRSVWICPIPFLTIEFAKDYDIHEEKNERRS